MEIKNALGAPAAAGWRTIEDFVLNTYDVTKVWYPGGKGGLFEMKFKRGAKTLCSLFVREKSFGFMIIYGKDERAAFEAQKNNFTKNIQTTYTAATTFHDGKWIMINVADDGILEDLKKMIQIKKIPRKKK